MSDVAERMKQDAADAADDSSGDAFFGLRFLEPNIVAAGDAPTSASASGRPARSAAAPWRSVASSKCRSASLASAAGAAAAWFSVSLIPTTLELTTLGVKTAGDPVNLEVDVVAKYIEQLLPGSRS